MDDQKRARRRLLNSPDRNIGLEPQSKIFRKENTQRSSSEYSGARGSSQSYDSGPSTSHAAGNQHGGKSDSSRRDAGNPNKRIFNDRLQLVHTRPPNLKTKLGASGEPIDLLTNHFVVKTTPAWRIEFYHVTFLPDIELVRVRAGVLSQLAEVLGKGYVFDGSQLFTTKKFEQTVTTLNCKSKRDIDYEITIKHIGTISSAEPQFLQVLNLILRRAMKGLNLELVGRNLYDSQARVTMRDFQFELWPGYETSIRQHEQDILLCAGITHKVMRTETVYDILRKCSLNPQRHEDEFRSNVLGLVVLTDYNNKTYRINDVDFTKNPLATFNCKGKDISFVEYYSMKYNIRIKDRHQPLLISKNRDKAQNTKADDLVILIPELCRVTGLTDSMRSNIHLMKAVSSQTNLNPSRRIERLRGFNRRLQSTPESFNVLKNWNMTLDNDLMKIKGRTIDPIKIVFQNNRISAGHNADWTRNFRNEALLETPREGLNRWAVIAPDRNREDLQMLLQNMCRVASGMGLQIARPQEFMLYDDRTNSYIKAMENSTRYDIQMVLCLVPNNNTQRYSAIKKRGCVDIGIPTQVISSRVVRKGLPVATKLVIQMNCKLGFVPWMIEIPTDGLMTIGFDIAKCTSDRSKAYGALIATMDLRQSRTFFSTVAECSAYDVLANNLWPMMLKALREYHKFHKKFPKKILFYRDGVSSGSLKNLVDYEVKQIVEELQKLSGDNTNPPELAYIVVNKASNAKFFTSTLQNPPPGTVVDDSVTLPESYDFFLVSQCSQSATVSPTNYNVVHSTMSLSPDRIQQLTYRMCHLYYNWSATTRVPAVCQYGKRLATLVASHLHALPKDSLNKKFYYL